jgi:hypothetical protein
MVDQDPADAPTVVLPVPGHAIPPRAMSRRPDERASPCVHVVLCIPRCLIDRYIGDGAGSFGLPGRGGRNRLHILDPGTDASGHTEATYRGPRVSAQDLAGITSDIISVASLRRNVTTGPF